jgi:hypothetical protein
MSIWFGLALTFSPVARFSRQVPVLAYQVGAGLAELFTPTNGAIMAVLLGANVPYERWLRFAVMAVIALAPAAGSWLIFWTPSRRRLAVKPTCRSAGRFASPLPMPKSPGSLMTVSVRSAFPSAG